MIVVDTSQLAYLLIGGAVTKAARQVFLIDPEWAAPILWRSEFRNLLAHYLRKGELKQSQATKLQEKAEELLAGREYLSRSDQILRLVTESTLSAYDCECVALARELRVPLVTSDKAILREFPAIAMPPEVFVQRGA
ncbi:MAG: type II toxin-antitoxin system VapC family toxin [Candidatus Eisenbacteria bacterium]|uniref:Ribonuclease VapC n=1 Tax=Eiseniibacteriota bacterium TaxID=2212470 RepID=A0A948W6R2_UNCEI|nr:type II toxin-antitoxin system VapC family toxin [Candidatus Eisenbacteria bacterium]MBU1950980.1 type II toxin-antitoxin system VapC family toxin [Candidatus Eisenbacteria bacterium]MBU2690911.1 type II toxin-antitoxin system VapC family toxin [Candidatus Eisenbacteria bacterium]